MADSIKKLTILFLLSLSIVGFNSYADPDPSNYPCSRFDDTGRYGLREYVAGNFYVVLSELVEINDSTGASRHINTSNIYLIKGNQNLNTGKTAVWIFGSGYGDKNSDIAHYLQSEGLDWDASRSALEDAADINCVVEEYMELDSSTVSLRFIAPHFHLDHMNMEILDALFGKGQKGFEYSFSDARLFLHSDDMHKPELEVLGSNTLMCTEPCCSNVTGNSDCNPSSNLWGSPYDPSFRTSVIDRFETLPLPIYGEADTICSTLFEFKANETGKWRVVSTPGHTDGTVSIRNNNYFIQGAKLQGETNYCMPDDLVILPIHGRY